MFFNPPKIKSCPADIPLPMFLTQEESAYINIDDNKKIYRPVWQTPYGTTNDCRFDAYEDFDYLEQSYPVSCRKYINRIENILDKVDYEDSMIYDEYPDYYLVRMLCDSVIKTLQNEGICEKDITNELNDLVRVLVCNNIYRRRIKKSSCGNCGLHLQ